MAYLDAVLLRATDAERTLWLARQMGYREAGLRNLMDAEEILRQAAAGLEEAYNQLPEAERKVRPEGGTYGQLVATSLSKLAEKLPEEG